MTPLDTAHAQMMAAPEDENCRLRFFERLADAELYLLLEDEARGDAVEPKLVEAQNEQLVLVFDRDTRLSTFAGGIAPHVTLSGRSLAQMLMGQGLGLFLNPEVAESSFALDAAGVAWLAETLAHAPEEEEDQIAELQAPHDVPEVLLSALDQKLAAAEGLAQAAFLVRTTNKQGRVGHLLAFLGALPDAEPALAQAVSEALTFSGIEMGQMDVSFFDSAHPIVARLTRVGLRFDLPQPQAPLQGSAPGSDPARPPILK